MDMKEYQRELARTKREVAVAVNKPEHMLQPKNIREVEDENGRKQWVGSCLITSIRNREKRSYGAVDAAGNDRGQGVVVEASITIAAKNIVDGISALSSDAEIQEHFFRQKKMRELIENREIERKRNEVAV